MDPVDELLPEELLARIRSRAPDYDRDNAFFSDDLAELTASGYLTALVPRESGGAGGNLLDVVRSQARLAAAAPATALGIGMHLIWTGVARMLHERGETFLDVVLEDAAAGEIFAFAISEPANDQVLLDSVTVAEPLADGGYSFTGMKIFTSLSPVWTRLGTFGRDDTSDDAPKLVHAVLARGTTGVTVIDDWDTVGMRATRSNTTRLDGAVAEPGRVFRRLDPGDGSDPLILAIFANFELLVAAVYLGIAERALELAVDEARARTVRSTGSTRDQDPATRRRIAEIAMGIDAVRAQVESLASDVDTGVDHGAQWFRLLVGAKSNAVRTARAAVDDAIAVSGGAAFRSSAELSRLYRDVLAGGFHPSNDEAAHSTVAAAVLGPLESGSAHEGR